MLNVTLQFSPAGCLAKLLPAPRAWCRLCLLLGGPIFHTWIWAFHIGQERPRNQTTKSSKSSHSGGNLGYIFSTSRNAKEWSGRRNKPNTERAVRSLRARKTQARPTCYLKWLSCGFSRRVALTVRTWNQRR